MQPPIARFLDIIVYSREQIVKETQSIAGAAPYTVPDVPWGIISIKPQMEVSSSVAFSITISVSQDTETPMQPITMMRNALGRDQGGSGVALDAVKYQEAVDYWKRHAIVM